MAVSGPSQLYQRQGAPSRTPWEPSGGYRAAPRRRYLPRAAVRPSALAVGTPVTESSAAEHADPLQVGGRAPHGPVPGWPGEAVAGAVDGDELGVGEGLHRPLGVAEG